MLTTLHIENFAVIQTATLKPHHQFTAITGETGAGKSILVDALALLQGARADKSHIQAGKQSARIEGHFNISHNPSAKKWLQNEGLLQGNTCTITRVLDQHGKSRLYINDHICTLQTLKGFGQHLIRIHAQHQYHTLLDRENHLALLDRFANLENSAQSTQQHYQQWRKTVEHIQQIQAQHHAAKQRYDLLTYQTQELRHIDLSTSTLRAHYAQHERLSKAEATLELCHKLRETINNDEGWSLLSLNQTAQRLLNNKAPLTPHLTPLQEVAKLLDEQHIFLQECLRHLDDAEQQVDIDPEQLAELETYLDAINTLARKHRTTPETLEDTATRLENERHELEINHLSLDALRDAEQEQWAAYRTHAERLSQQRHAAAQRLNHALTEYIQILGMKETRIEFSFTHTSSPTADEQLKQQAGPLGFDEGELFISNHPKLPFTPLKKTASGGELSRLSLALFIITEQQPGTTLIFDEVDTGMGGEIGDLLGAHLQSLSERQQVMCITHLPQVAARANRHVHVSKTSDEDSVASTAHTLNLKERRKELERMLGLSGLRNTFLVDTLPSAHTPQQLPTTDQATTTQAMTTQAKATDAVTKQASRAS